MRTVIIVCICAFCCLSLQAANYSTRDEPLPIAPVNYTIYFGGGLHAYAGADFSPLGSYIGVNLLGADFHYADLLGADFTDAGLSHMDLADADLSHANFSGTNLSASNLSGAYLLNADFSLASLSSANLEGAYVNAFTDFSTATFYRVRSGNIYGTTALLPTGFFLMSGYIVGVFYGGGSTATSNLSGADFTDSILFGCDFTNADLTGANFTRTNFFEVTFFGADLTDAIFTGCDLSDVILDSANLAGVVSGGVWTNTPLPPPWLLVGGYLAGPGANLSGTDLSYLTFIEADLSGANLAGANLEYASFFNTDLTGADFTGVNSGSVNVIESVLPAGWILHNGYLVGPGAVLTNADLSGADLGGISLEGAVLGGVMSGGITGVPVALPANWQLIGGYLIGPGANLAGANLDGLDLSGMELTDVSSGNITGTPLGLPAGWSLTGGYLIGPGANLTNADLAGADLSGIDFTGSDLSGANLIGADLSAAVFDPSIQPVSDNLFTRISDLKIEIATIQTELDNTFFLSEIAAMRPSSEMIEIVGGEATLSFTLQQAPDLDNWTDTPVSTQVTVPAPDPGKKYFRLGD